MKKRGGARGGRLYKNVKKREKNGVPRVTCHAADGNLLNANRIQALPRPKFTVKVLLKS